MGCPYIFIDMFHYLFIAEMKYQFIDVLKIINMLIRLVWTVKDPSGDV